MIHPTEFALRLVKQGFMQAHPLSGIGFLTAFSFGKSHVYKRNVAASVIIQQGASGSPEYLHIH